MASATRAVGVFDLRHGGLALSTSLAATVNLVLLAVLLGKRAGGFAWASWLGSTLRTLVASLTMVPVVRVIVSRVEWFDGVTPLRVRIVWLLLAVGAGASVCALALNLVGGAEMVAFRRAVVSRISRRAVARPS
jgi:putative peptidoglycan lipid II flippase